MGDNIKTIAYQLQNNPIFSECNPQDIGRLLPFVTEKYFPANQVIFSPGIPANQLFLIVEGTAQITSVHRNTELIPGDCLGEESAIESEFYLREAIAISPVRLLIIPRYNLQKLLDIYPDIKNKLYLLLLKTYAGNQIIYSDLKHLKKPKDTNIILETIGWFLTTLIPIILLFSLAQTSLNWNDQLFITIISATLLMWFFNLVPVFIPGIFSILSFIILGIAPSTIVLSGFASGEFFMALSIFGLGAVLATSGLTYRLGLIILKNLPNGQFWHSSALFAIGSLLTALIPSANGRVKLVNPILLEMVEVMDLDEKGKAATRLAFDAFWGTSLLSSCFLSSKSANFIMLGLFPNQIREQFSWGYWALASAIAGISAIILHLITTSLLFRNQEITKISRQNIAAQLEIIGPMNKREWIAAGSILLFLLGVLTSSLHKIALPWMALAILYICLDLEILKQREFQKNVDWTFLIFLGSLVGMAQTMSYLGLDKYLSNYLAWTGNYMNQNFSLFLLGLSLLIYLLRFMIPNAVMVAICGTIFIPIAEKQGINPWLIGFVILTISDGWFLPYQCPHYLLFQEETDKNEIYNKKYFLACNIFNNLIRLISIYISLPYWKLLGIL